MSASCRLTWSATLWLSLAALALTIACTVDFFIDRRQDTPLVLRYGMFVAQATLWIATAVFFGAWALFRSMGDEDLALHVEERLPEFDDRLISALQLNRPGADTKGMSPELIAAVTRQAEEQAAGVDFVGLADPAPLVQAARVLPTLIFCLLLAYVVLVGHADGPGAAAVPGQRRDSPLGGAGEPHPRGLAERRGGRAAFSCQRRGAGERCDRQRARHAQAVDRRQHGVGGRAGPRHRHRQHPGSADRRPACPGALQDAGRFEAVPASTWPPSTGYGST